MLQLIIDGSRMLAYLHTLPVWTTWVDRIHFEWDISGAGSESSF